MLDTTVSINLCVYKPKELLASALDCLVRQDTQGKFTFEIVVVDDEPSAEVERYVKEFARTSASVPVRYVCAGGRGIAYARNMGARESRGEWLAWFDQDQTVESNWLFELCMAARASGADWIDGPRDLVLPDGHVAHLNSYLRACLGEIDRGEFLHQHFQRYASCTGNALVRKAVFESVGLFDETIVDGWEDWDYVRRWRAEGHACWYAPRALVHHVIPEERLGKAFFEWHAVRVGVAFASRDAREWGLPRTLIACVARIGQGFLVHVPLLVLAKVRRDKVEQLTRTCLLLRASSYLCKCAHSLAPAVFPQRHLRARVRLREEPRYAAKEEGA